MPRENSKCRKWERERRDRLKVAFTELAKVLPCYSPSVNIPKIDILQKAASNIRELEDNVKKLLSSNTEKTPAREDIIKKLHDRIKKLLVRNEQLSNLLRDAGIPVPSACGTAKRFKRNLQWSNKISPEQAKLLQKNEMEKENISSKLVHDKKKKRKTVNMGIAPKHRTSILKGVEQKGTAQKRKKINKKIPTSNCFIILSQPTTMIRRDFNIGQQCYFIANEPSNNMYKNIIKSGITNSGMHLKSMPLTSKSRVPKSLLLVNPSVPSLGPGSLILANGTILSNFQTPPTSSNLLLDSAICTFSKTDNSRDNECDEKDFCTKRGSQASGSRNVKTLPYIKPKYCLTRTTQVNKVPIPALTSRYANNYILLNENRSECVKANETEKIKKLNKTNQPQDSNKANKKKGDKRKNESEGECSAKKSKSDCNTEPTSNITCASISDNLITTSTSSHTSLVAEDDSIKLKATDKIDPKDAVNDVIENIVTDKDKEGNGCKSHNTETNVPSVNVDVPASTSNSFEKKQDSVKLVNNEASHVEMTFASTVTATTLTTTTTHEDIKHLDLNLSHSELSNDIFASLQVPSGCQNPDSTSPTAAFLLAFPLVSSGIKVTEVIDEENSESQRGTPNLLQIGTMDSTKPTQSHTDTITSNFLNLDNFSFFSSKDICGNIYNSYPNTNTKTGKSPASMLNTSNKSDTVTNKSIYVNIKSPCLPTCVAEPVKENYNMFHEKPVPTKDVGNVEGCEKTGIKVKDNISFNNHNQSNSKVNLNYMVDSKNTSHTERNFDHKSQFYVPTTYPNSNCSFSYKSEPSKVCTTCSYVNINRNYANPLYTNCSNYNYNYHPDTNFNQNYYKNIPRNETKSYYPLNYENYSDYRKNETTALPGRYDPSTYTKEKKNNNAVKVKTSQNKLPINWMTTPDSRLQSSECLLNSFSKGDFSQTYPFSSYVTTSSTYFTTTSMDTSNVNCAMEPPKKCLDLPIVSLNSHQRPEPEEKQFSWSPTKLPHFLDPPHNFVTPTLPTLVGDLALGNPLTFGEQKNDYNKHLKDNRDFRLTNKVSNFETQTNFLSVSQLVDHNKPEHVPAKTSARRNSGNRSKNAQHKVKRAIKHENKDLLPNCGNNNDKINQIRSTSNYNLSNEVFQKNRNPHKNTSSSYSAEALIGNQIPDESVAKRYPPASSKSLGVSSFLAENIISYFPPVDLPQDNYMSQNQNYPTSNFTHNLSTTFQNNTYSTNSFIYTAPTITSTYLSTNTFEPSAHDYLQENLNLMQNPAAKDNKLYNPKNFNNRQQNKEDKNYQHVACANNFRRPKKKPTNESNNGLANFDFPFLSIPGSNNSPILPDDFHSHVNFLPPTTPFSCKNAIYPKQGADISTGPLIPLAPVSKSSIQHPEISPSMNSVGTSLTNFNLSTIFPEINKGPIPELYTDGRIKEHSHTKSYASAVPQVSFNTEPKFSFNS